MNTPTFGVTARQGVPDDTSEAVVSLNRNLIDLLLIPLQAALLNLWGKTVPGLSLFDAVPTRHESGGRPKLNVEFRGHSILYTTSGNRLLGNVWPCSISLVHLAPSHPKREQTMASLVDMIDREFRNCYPELF